MVYVCVPFSLTENKEVVNFPMDMDLYFASPHPPLLP